MKFLAKTAKNMSNQNRKRAVGALLTLIGEDNDAKQVAEYLTKLHYSVCQAFFNEFCSLASEESVIAIAEALVNDEQFKKGNPNNTMYPKGLSAVLALASKGKYQASFLVLNRILSQSEKLSGFSDGCTNNFKKLIVDKNGISFILNLLEQVTKGACKEFEHNRLARFLKSLEEKVVVTSHEEGAVTLTNSESTQSPVSVATPSKPAPDALEQKQEKASNGVEAIARIEKNQQEILAAIYRFADSRSSIESLSSTIARRDEEISAIKSDLAEKERCATSLVSEIGMKSKCLGRLINHGQRIPMGTVLRSSCR